MRHLGRTLVVSLLLPWAVLAQGPPDPLPAVDRILARYVEASGGAAALEALDTRIVRGRTVTDLPYRGAPVDLPMEGVAEFPDRWSLTVAGSPLERTWCDGSQVWNTRDNATSSGGGGIRTRASFLLDPRGPLRVAEYFPGLRVTGREVVAGRAVWVVENDLDPAYNALRFDAETGRLVQIGHYWRLLDYRWFDGVTIPTRVVQSRKGGSTTWSWHEVEHNQPIDASRFAPPR